MNASPLIRMSQATASGAAGLLGDFSAWCAAHFARAPITSTGVVLMVLGYGLATGNALYGQSAHHPAPLFGAIEHSAGLEIVPMPPTPAQRSVAEDPAPNVVPATQPASVASEAAAPGSGAANTHDTVIGNAEVAALQEKLLAMGLFDGTVDGYYGPKTADAIRAFEDRFDMPRTGAVSVEVLEAVANAPLSTSAAVAPSQPGSPGGSAQTGAVTLGAPPADLAPPATAQGPAASGDAASETTIAALMAPDAGMTETGQPGPQIALASLAVPASGATTEDGPTAEPGMFESLLALATRQETPTQPLQPSLDTQLVSSVQTGLAQLGFLRAPVTGVAGDETARAIRNFEIFHNFEPSGTVSYALLDRLVAAGATL